MFKLWRRQLAKPTTPDLHARKKQSLFSQNIASLIKSAKKKEEFYFKALWHAHDLRPRSSTDQLLRSLTDQHPGDHRMGQLPSDRRMGQLQEELEVLITEQEQLMSSLKTHSQQPFFLSKTFLYTAFVRLLEMCECSRQRLLLKNTNKQKGWEKLYEEGKSALTECYQNLVYLQNYNVYELFLVSIRKQNHRLYATVPPKARKVQVSLKPLANRTSCTHFTKSHSIDVKPLPQREDPVAKKLVKKEKKIFLTEKRLEERKKGKKRQLTFKDLYGVLGVKPIKVEQGFAFRKGLEIEGMERNAAIIQEHRKWVKKVEGRSYSLKLVRAAGNTKYQP